MKHALGLRAEFHPSTGGMAYVIYRRLAAGEQVDRAERVDCVCHDLDARGARQRGVRRGAHMGGGARSSASETPGAPRAVSGPGLRH
jgi:hypothetical protein